MTGQKIVLVTHNPQVSERVQRSVRRRDGGVEVAPVVRAETMG